MDFLIADMTCAHCAGVITKAIIAIDGSATIRIDIDARTAAIASTAGADEIAHAIAEAGYTPVLQCP